MVVMIQLVILAKFLRSLIRFLDSRVETSFGSSSLLHLFCVYNLDSWVESKRDGDSRITLLMDATPCGQDSAVALVNELHGEAAKLAAAGSGVIDIVPCARRRRMPRASTVLASGHRPCRAPADSRRAQPPSPRCGVPARFAPGALVVGTARAPPAMATVEQQVPAWMPRGG